MHNGFPRCALVKLKGIDLAHEKGLENWQPAQETNFTDLTKPSLGFDLGHGNLAFEAACCLEIIQYMDTYMKIYVT